MAITGSSGSKRIQLGKKQTTRGITTAPVKEKRAVPEDLTKSAFLKRARLAKQEEKEYTEKEGQRQGGAQGQSPQKGGVVSDNADTDPCLF